MFRHHAIRVFIVTLVAFASNTLAFNAMHPTQRKRLSLFNHKMMMSNEGDGDSPSSLTISSTGTTTRRTFFHRSVAAAAAGVVGGGAVVVQQQEAAWASGGATAGGAYLLSAKQRYNERVTKGVKELLAVVDGLKKNDVDAARDYFIKRDDAGSWNDLTSAGYLLSNAFRTNSSTPPERLTSVKVRKDKEMLLGDDSIDVFLLL